jgi:aqualysin 1
MHKKMNREFAALVCLAVVISLFDYATGQLALSRNISNNLAQVGAAGSMKNGIVPDQYIVQLKNGVIDPAGVAAAIVSQYQGEMKRTYSKVISGFAAKIPATAVEALRRNPNVVRIEPDHLVSLEARKPTTYISSWGIDRIDQRDLPMDNVYNYISSGEGVNVYVIDSGIRLTHTEFGGRAIGAFSLVNDGNGANDCHGHGTHVAGTIGGATVGVARKATLHAVRIFNCNGDSIPESDLLAALDWVAQNKVSPAVINLSLGAVADSSIVNTAVENVIAAGTPVVVAAGNATTDACLYTPAAAPSAITVAASSRYDQGSGFSNYGPCVDLYAPGSGINSAWATADNAYAENSGTSMATPHVTGVAALYLSQNPSATPADVTNAIMSNATLGKLTYIPSGSPNYLLYSLFSSIAPPNTAPFSIVGYNVSAISSTAATVSWTTNEPSTGSLAYKGKTGSEITLYENTLSQFHTVNVTSLQRGATYSYTINATNGTDTDVVAGSFKTAR